MGKQKVYTEWEQKQSDAIALKHKADMENGWKERKRQIEKAWTTPVLQERIKDAVEFYHECWCNWWLDGIKVMDGGQMPDHLPNFSVEIHSDWMSRLFIMGDDLEQYIHNSHGQLLLRDRNSWSQINGLYAYRNAVRYKTVRYGGLDVVW